jgi:hypothetical protein
MNNYSNNTSGARRWMPIMAMPNGQVFFLRTDAEERQPRWPELQDTKQHSQTEGRPDKKAKGSCD